MKTLEEMVEVIVIAGDAKRFDTPNLYAGAGGRLFQPSFLRVRFDKTAEECGTSQLVHVNKTVVK